MIKKKVYILLFLSCSLSANVIWRSSMFTLEFETNFTPCSSLFTADFEQMSHIDLVSLVLNFNEFHTLF